MIEVRQPSLEEMPAVLQLRNDVLGEPYGCDRDVLPTVIQVAAFDGGRIVGTVHIEEHEEYGTYVHRMAVHPDYRGQGLGRRILGEAEQRAVVAGATVLSLYSQSAVGFFKNCGYGPTGEMAEDEHGQYTKMSKAVRHAI